MLSVGMATASSVLAAVPLSGTVYEGERVPGISLGYTRGQVEEAYGQPYYCQTYAIPDDFAFCTYPEGGGTLVSVRYEGADGGFAHNQSNDQAFVIRWGEALDGWTTTAGVDTALAKNSPDEAMAAYPDAEVTYRDPDTRNFVESITDWLQGIEIRRTFDGYTGHIHASMSIFVPQPSLPVAQETHVQKIELSATKDRGIRKVYGWAEILDEHGRAATSASVDATWILPDGSTQPAVEDFVGVNGVAFFELFGPKGRSYRGAYTLRIDDVIYGDHTFSRADSILSGSVQVK